MKILFVHNSFPAQFQQLQRVLAEDPTVTMAAVGAPNARAMKGVRLIKYRMPESDVSGTHPFARRFDMECRRAEQVLYSLSTLKASGFVPDVILAHPGWGETLPLRTVFPKARILLYCEFFYGAEGRDIGFDPEFPEGGLDGGIALQLKNATTLLALSDADRGVSPTPWQRLPGLPRSRRPRPRRSFRARSQSPTPSRCGSGWRRSSSRRARWRRQRRSCGGRRR
jgi:hypothetical protein